jgi:hypothetical protein
MIPGQVLKVVAKLIAEVLAMRPLAFGAEQIDVLAFTNGANHERKRRLGKKKLDRLRPLHLRRSQRIKGFTRERYCKSVQ